MQLIKIAVSLLIGLLIAESGFAQTDTTIYHLILRNEKVNKAGKEDTGTTINGSIPGPLARFVTCDTDATT